MFATRIWRLHATSPTLGTNSLEHLKPIEAQCCHLERKTNTKLQGNNANQHSNHSHDNNSNNSNNLLTPQYDMWFGAWLLDTSVWVVSIQELTSSFKYLTETGCSWVLETNTVCKINLNQTNTKYYKWSFYPCPCYGIIKHFNSLYEHHRVVHDMECTSAPPAPPRCFPLRRDAPPQRSFIWW